MTRTIINTYTTVHTHRTLIIRVLFVGCIFATLWYGINIYNAISRTIAIEHISNDVAVLGDTINQLDSQYIKLADKALPSVLPSYGMSQSGVSAYIQRTPSLGSVAISGHEF